MNRRLIATCVAAILLGAAFVLARYGVGEPGLRAIIRFTARTSALCVAFAFARVRTRELLIVLPISHALHYAAIGALAILTTPANAHIAITSIGGVAILLLMIATAVRPTTAGLYLLWIIFIVAFGIRDMHVAIYPVVFGILLVAGVVRAASGYSSRRQQVA
jgi:hypothetical protein